MVVLKRGGRGRPVSILLSLAAAPVIPRSCLWGEQESCQLCVCSGTPKEWAWRRTRPFAFRATDGHRPSKRYPGRRQGACEPAAHNVVRNSREAVDKRRIRAIIAGASSAKTQYGNSVRANVTEPFAASRDAHDRPSRLFRPSTIRLVPVGERIVAHSCSKRHARNMRRRQTGRGLVGMSGWLRGEIIL